LSKKAARLLGKRAPVLFLVLRVRH
jgi:hypothetical protein